MMVIVMALEGLMSFKSIILLLLWSHVYLSLEARIGVTHHFISALQIFLMHFHHLVVSQEVISLILHLSALPQQLITLLLNNAQFLK